MLDTGTGLRGFIGHQFNRFETSAGDLRVVGTYPISDSCYLKANPGLALIVRI